MNYNNLAKLCKEEADSALGEMAGSNGDSDIISRYSKGSNDGNHLWNV